MALPHFNYLEPKTVKEASIMLAEHEDKARLIAGGTDLLLGMQHRVIQPEFIISLSRIPDIDYIHSNHTKEVTIGAMARLAAVADHPCALQPFPALADAAGYTATVQIRNMGTVVGNICNASPSADTATPLLVYDARLQITHPGGERFLPIAEFFRGPGLTALEPGEVVKELILPVPAPHTGSDYQKLSCRSKVDIAAVGVSALITLDANGVITKARIALGAVAPIPLRAQRAEKILAGNIPSADLLNAAAKASAGEASPITDIRASQSYRKAMVEVLTERALENSVRLAWQKTTGEVR